MAHNAAGESGLTQPDESLNERGHGKRITAGGPGGMIPAA